MQVRECPPAGAAAWDDYVERHPAATFFHLYGWRRVLGEALGHRTYYLVAEQDGALAGVLPLVQVKSALFGNTLSSLAFCTEAGPLADDDETRRALEAAASGLAHQLGVDALEYRLAVPSGHGGRVSKDLYETFSKPIFGDEDANLQAIRGKQRNIIRKGIKNGLQYGPDTLERFYAVYAESVRNLGTPVFPRRLFARLLAEFPNRTELVSATLDGRAVSSALNVYFRDSVCPYYWGGTYAARDLKGNDFLAWSILCGAAARGCTVFDFGRSKQGTGAYQWKENLGFEPRPLHYEYELVRATVMPDINPLNPKYRLFVTGWKKLPLAVAGLLGPWISRNLG